MISVNLYLQFQSIVSILLLFFFNFTLQYINSFLATSFALKFQNLKFHVTTGFFFAGQHYFHQNFSIFCFYVFILKIFKLPPRSVWAFPTCQPTPPKVNFESVGTKSCLLQYEITYFQQLGIFPSNCLSCSSLPLINFVFFVKYVIYVTCCAE